MMTADSSDNQPDKKTGVTDSDVPAERRNSDAVSRKPPTHNKPSDVQAGDADSSSLETEDSYGGGTLSPNISFKESLLEPTNTGLGPHNISDPEILKRIEEMLTSTQPKKLASLQQDTSFNISPSQSEESQASPSKSTDDKPSVRSEPISVNKSTSETDIEASDVELIDNEPTTQNKPPVQSEPIVLSESTGEMDSESSGLDLIPDAKLGDEPTTSNKPSVRSQPIPVVKLADETDADLSDVELVDEEPSPQNKSSIRAQPIAQTGSTDEPSVVEQADSEPVDIESLQSKPTADHKPEVRSKPVALTEGTAQAAKTEASETQPVASKDKKDDDDTVAPAVKVASVSPMVAAIVSANASAVETDDDQDDPAAPISEAASVSPMVAAIAATSRSLAETAEPSRDLIAEDQALIQTGPGTQPQYAPPFDTEPTSSEEPTTASPEPIAVSATTSAIMAPLAHVLNSSSAKASPQSDLSEAGLGALAASGHPDDESEDEEVVAWFDGRNLKGGITSFVVHLVLLLLIAFWTVKDMGNSKGKEKDLLIPPTEEIAEEETPEEETPDLEMPLDDRALEDELNQAAETAMQMDDIESPFESDTALSDVAPTPFPSPFETMISVEEALVEFSPARTGGEGDGTRADGGTGSGKGTGTGTGRGGLGGRSSRRKAVYGEETTQYSEEAVNKSINWIVHHQMRDGGWSFHHHLHRMCAGKCGNPGELGQARYAATGLALLPLLGAGHTAEQGEFSLHVAGGLSFLMSRQNANGSFWEPGGRMYSHGIATLALCEAYGMLAQAPAEIISPTDNEAMKKLDPKSEEAKAFRLKMNRIKKRNVAIANLRRAATRATAFIIKAQHPGGGWRYEPGEAGDTSVVGWQLMAMHSAQQAGLGFNQRSINGATAYLNSVQSVPAGDAAYGIVGTQYSYLPGKPKGSQATNAIGLISRVYLGMPARHPGIQAAVGRMSPSFSGDMYYNYYATQLMYQSGGPPWKRWNRSIQGYLTGSQQKIGHLEGSWFFPKGDHGADKGGRLYCTVMASLCLEESYRHMPLNRHAAGQFEEKDDPPAAVPGQKVQPNPGGAKPAAPKPRPGGVQPRPAGLPQLNPGGKRPNPGGPQPKIGVPGPARP